MIKKIALKIITIYQKTLSPDHGLIKGFFAVRVCKFTPTCSEYAYNAINKFGIIKGVRLGLSRLLRCHPWSKGGYDPLKK